MNKLNKVLFCVLNWGLGHASRSIPVIELLLSKGVEVTIASDGNALVLLQNKFPELKFFTLPAYNIQYSKSASTLPIKLLCQVPKLINSIEKEKQETQKLLNQENDFDLIVSDNRYGCYSNSIPSIIITHQLNLDAPIGFSWINKINSRLLNKFNSIWVPDNESKLSGKLSDSKLENEFIGYLSSHKKADLKKDIDFLISLSGPEPQRTILEEKILEIAPKSSKIVLVRGSSREVNFKTSFEVHNIASHDTMNNLLNRSKIVISRSGYSSLMDYKTLDLPAILIPTPGQSEQEYLAASLKGDPQFKVVNQKKLAHDTFNWNPKPIKQKGPNKMNEEALIKSLQNLGLITPT